MAVRDHKDLLPRSQDLSFSFLQHFLNNESTWFIKDKHARYLLASQSLAELYSIKKTIYKKTDQELYVLSHQFRKKMRLYERYVLKTKKSIQSLEVNYFNSCNRLSIYTFEVTPFIHENKIFTLTYAKEPDNVNTVQIVFDHLGISNERLSNVSSTLEKPVSSFIRLNPLKRVSSKQWEVAWLVLAGLSYREIAQYTKINVNNVEKKLQSAYKNLGVFCQQNFLAIGGANNWISYIPNGLLQNEGSYVLKR